MYLATIITRIVAIFEQSNVFYREKDEPASCSRLCCFQHVGTFEDRGKHMVVLSLFLVLSAQPPIVIVLLVHLVRLTEETRRDRDPITHLSLLT